MKSNRFRCQYQKGKTCVSETVESETPITSAQILYALISLAIKVQNNISKSIGERVALKVLEIHEFIIKNVHGYMSWGDGSSKSFNFDKTSKTKDERSERVDLEFRGYYGIQDQQSILNKYILGYREMKSWDRQ